MDELFQQLGTLLGKEILIPGHPVKISQIVILVVFLAISFGLAKFLRWRFRQFLKDRLLALLLPTVMIAGMLLGLQFAGIEIGILYFPLADLFFQSPETEIEVSETNRFTLAGLFWGFVIVFSMFILSKYVQGVIDKQSNIEENIRSILKRFLPSIFIGIGVLISLSIIGIRLTGLAIGIGGLIGGLSVGIGIGLQNTASNLISRLIIFFQKLIKEGDLVEIRERNLFGQVASIDLCSTVIVSLDEKTVIIPNSQLTTESINNLTHENTLFQLRIAVGVSYNSDVEVVKKALIEAAHEQSEVIKEPCPDVENVTLPLVRLINFEQSSLNFELLVWISDSFRRFDISSDLHLKVLEKFKANNIRIVSSQRDTDFYPREPE